MSVWWLDVVWYKINLLYILLRVLIIVIKWTTIVRRTKNNDEEEDTDFDIRRLI